MASSMLVMSEPGSALVTSAPSSCSSSLPIGAPRRAPAGFDFSAYLLSASPPGFELPGGAFSCGLPPSERFSSSNVFQVTVSSGAPERSWWSAASSSSSSRLEASDSDLSPTHSVRSSLSGSRPSSSGTSGGLTKKVSFADDLGMLLEQVRVFQESSDTPPNISPRVLRRYASVENLSTPFGSAEFKLGRGWSQRLSASMPSLQQAVFTVPRLLPNFSMPSANRSAFLERVDRACVSLESVRVLPVESGPATTLNGCPPAVIDRLVGSVAVRNLAFEKSVTARCTFDGWASYVNVRAVYARSERVARRSATGQPLGGGLEFDVFDFSVNLPVRWRTVHGDRPRAELAIRYDVGGQTFWDNNYGQNYELVGTYDSSTWSRYPDDSHVTPCWTEFSGWKNVDTSCPYW